MVVPLLTARAWPGPVHVYGVVGATERPVRDAERMPGRKTVVAALEAASWRFLWLVSVGVLARC
jgi:hypothetical protein